MDDSELLAEFGRERSGKAFEEIVRRYTDLVYSAALRQMRNVDEAEEVTQAVFVILSRKAGMISPDAPLIGWLLTTTRFAAMNLRRAKIRRAHHERKAAVMEEQMEPLPQSDSWKEVAPLLDAAMASLKSDQRNAVALRYFQGQPFAAVASRMGISEEAAKKRVTRGVEKLRKFFARRGVAIPMVGLTATIATHAVNAAPMHVAASCAVASKGSAALGAELLRIMVMGKIKAIASGILATAAMGGAAVVTMQMIHARSPGPITAVANPPAVPLVPRVMPSPVTMIHSNITGPDGKPLAGITVYNASRVHPVSIYPLASGQPTMPMLFINLDGSVSQVVHLNVINVPAPKATTDQNGHFDLRIDLRPSMLVVNDDRGFAKVRIDDFKEGDPIQLQAWARVEGTINLRDRKGIDSRMYLADWQDFQDRYGCEVIESSSVPIDAQGHFVFPRVPPGPVWVYMKVTPDARQDFIGPSTFVHVDAGQTASVAITDGRTVKGKFVSPAGADAVIAWHDSGHSTNCMLRAQVSNTMPQPANWREMNPLEKVAYREAWRQTPAAQSWNEALLPQTPTVQADGSFQMVGVKPGHYHLEMRQTEYDRSTGFGDDTASFATDIIVPDDANAQPLDLGELTIKIEPMLRVNQPAPELAAAPLAAGGGAIHLSDYRGKYVLIHAWQIAQTSPDAVHIVDMPGLDKEYGSNDKIALLGINHDLNVSAARAFVTANHLDHWIMASARELNALPDEYKHISGGAVLIGPDGMVIGKHLSGDQLAALLRRELTK